MLVRHLRLFFALLPFLALTDAGEDTTDDTSDADTGDRDDSGNEAALGDKGKKALAEEREARRKAEADRKALQDRLDQIEAESRKRADDEAAEQGRFRELAEQREAELAESRESLTATTATLETLEAYVKADIDTVTKAVKEAAKSNDVAAVLQDIHPGDDADVSDLIAWLGKAKPRMAAITGAGHKPGNGPGPKPAGNERVKVESPLTIDQILNS